MLLPSQFKRIETKLNRSNKTIWAESLLEEKCEGAGRAGRRNLSECVDLAAHGTPSLHGKLMVIRSL